ncbi:MAG: hypothetical protein GY940_34680, partial [bacterium]|nr:hypothetical protein [bacterium]
KAFIEELIDSQLLVSELEPAITGPEFLDQISSILERLQGIDTIKNIISHTQKTLQQLDNRKIGTTISYYHQVAKDLEPLETGFELKFLFQTDMVKPVRHCTIEHQIAREVLMGIEVLNRLTMKPPETNLTRFRDAFSERYETREISLVQALDTEAGLGYKQGTVSGDVAPLVEDLVLPGAAANESQDIKWNRVQRLLFRKYREAIANKQYQVELTDEDLEPFEPVWDDLPDTFSGMVQIVDVEGNNKNKSIKARPTILLTGVGGRSAGNLLGRFCHADPTTD